MYTTKTVGLAVIVCSAWLAGCSAFRAAEPLAADQRHVCRPGSALKYRQSVDAAWPHYWIPSRPGGSCRSY